MSKRSGAKQESPEGQYRQILLDKRASVLADLGTKAHALATGERISEEDQAQHALGEDPTWPIQYGYAVRRRSK